MSWKCFVGVFLVPFWIYWDINQVLWQSEKWLMIWGQYLLSPTLCKNILLDGGHVFWPIALINKRNYWLGPPMPYTKFGVDNRNISKVLFILLFLTLCKLASPPRNLQRKSLNSAESNSWFRGLKIKILQTLKKHTFFKETYFFNVIMN